MEEPTTKRRTKPTARKTTGSKPPRKQLAARSAVADPPLETPAPLPDSPAKKKRQKRANAPHADVEESGQPIAGPGNRQAWLGFGGAAAPQAVLDPPGLYPGLISLKQLSDLAQTSQGVAQSHLQAIRRRVQELQAEYDASRTETAELRAEVARLRETNRQLYSENVALRQQNWGVGRMTYS